MSVAKLRTKTDGVSGIQLLHLLDVLPPRNLDFAVRVVADVIVDQVVAQILKAVRNINQEVNFLTGDGMTDVRIGIVAANRRAQPRKLRRLLITGDGYHLDANVVHNHQILVDDGCEAALADVAS